MVFVVHPVTWEALSNPGPCCQHEQQLQEALLCLSSTRAATSLVPRGVGLTLMASSWEREVLGYCLGSKGQAAAPALLCLTAPQGFLGPLSQTSHSFPWTWGLGSISSIKLHLGLGVVPPPTAQMLRLLGSC